MIKSYYQEQTSSNESILKKKKHLIVIENTSISIEKKYKYNVLFRTNLMFILLFFFFFFLKKKVSIDTNIKFQWLTDKSLKIIP